MLALDKQSYLTSFHPEDPFVIEYLMVNLTIELFALGYGNGRIFSKKRSRLLELVESSCQGKEKIEFNR